MISKTDIYFVAGQAIMYRLLGGSGMVIIEPRGGVLCLWTPAYAFLPEEARLRMAEAAAAVTGQDDAEVLWGRFQAAEEIACKYSPTPQDALVEAAGIAACSLAIERGDLPESVRMSPEPPIREEDVARAQDTLSLLWPEVRALAGRVQDAAAEDARLVLSASLLPATLRRTYLERGGQPLDDVWLPLEAEVDHAH